MGKMPFDTAQKMTRASETDRTRISVQVGRCIKRRVSVRRSTTVGMMGYRYRKGEGAAVCDAGGRGNSEPQRKV